MIQSIKLSSVYCYWLSSRTSWKCSFYSKVRNQHPTMKEHQQVYYGGRAWANELAKRGYVVLVSDAFTFASLTSNVSGCTSICEMDETMKTLKTSTT